VSRVTPGAPTGARYTDVRLPYGRGLGRRGAPARYSGGWAGAGPSVVVPGAVRWPRPVR